MPRARSNPLQFEAKLIGRGPGGAWTYLQVPLNVPEVFGRKGQVPVSATINGFTFRSSLMPRAGVHILGVAKDVLAAAGTRSGEIVEVKLALDEAPRTVEVPADVNAALKAAPAQHKAFDTLSYSHKKEYIDWITSAKKPETRQNRIKKTIEMLAAGKAVRS